MCPIAVGVGAGLCFVGGSPRSATLALISQYGGFWADANYPGALTMAAQPTLNDADMETVGTAAWTTSNGAISKVGGAHAGAQCLRLDYVAIINPLFSQGSINRTAGHRVAPDSAWVAGDGTWAPRILNGAGAGVSGTSSTAWQFISALECTITNTSFRVMGVMSGAGYVLCDDVSAGANLSITTLTPRFRSGDFAAATLANATAANQSWKSSGTINGKIVLQSADTDVLLVSTAASTLKFLHYGAAGALPQFTLSWNVRVTSLAADTTLLRTYAAGTHAGVWIYVTTAGVITVTWYDAAGGVLQTLTSAAGAIAINTSYVVTAWADTTSAGVIVNGADAIAATGMAFAPANSDPSNGQWLNGTATPVVGQSSNLVLVAGCASRAEALSVHREQAAEWGIAV